MFVSVNSYCRHLDGRAVIPTVYRNGEMVLRVQEVDTDADVAHCREGTREWTERGPFELVFRDKQGNAVPADEVLVFTPDPEQPGEWL